MVILKHRLGECAPLAILLLYDDLSEAIGTDLTHEWRWWLEFPQRKWTGNEDRDGRPEMRERLQGAMCSPGASGAWGLDFR